MSYIINSTNPFVSVKLTDRGRKQLAKGQLNFSFWGIGDSEINYDREELVENNLTDPAYSATTKILTPKDRQPDLKYFVSTGTTVLNPMSTANIRTVKAVINNQADERGFFSGTTGTYTTLTSSAFIQSTGYLFNTDLNGTNTINIGTGVTRNVGDYILLKIGNSIIGTLPLNTNYEPVPHLWYRIEASAGASITLDRNLPDVDSPGGVGIQYIIYPQGEVADAFGTGSTTAYWDSGTLAFDSACDVSIGDVDVWNMNNVWSEDLAGITGSSVTYEDHTKFGSYDYLGTKDPYLGFDVIGTSISGSTDYCEGISGFDNGQKSIAILHYTNNTISNFYGEIFYIDNNAGKTVTVNLPTLMYHRRAFTGGTGSGDVMGMTFLASGATETLTGTDIEYVDLIESPLLVTTPKVVGRVFPQLKIIVFTNEEIIASMSYKANRNWTLPALKATLQTSVSGSTAGILAENKTMYLTYILDNTTGSGFTTSLPCQKYTKIVNTTTTTKDVQFTLEDTGLLPYMRKIESSWDGRGFYAYGFKVIYQIVDNEFDRPLPDAWTVIDYTSTLLTTNIGETIDPIALENQSPSVNGFTITTTTASAGTTFDLISILNMAAESSPTSLQFGDERFFYGNISASIGATIYKTMFFIPVNSGQFNQTTNPTRDSNPSTNPTNLRVSEVGIYDSENNLVVIGKLSNPVELSVGNTILFELSLDF